MRKAMIFLLLVLALQSAALAQTPQAASDPGGDYRIGPKDIITLNILRMPELSRDYPVGATGTLEMPFLGSVNAQGKTSRELAKTIADGLRGDYLVDPQVTVTIKAYEPPPVPPLPPPPPPEKFSYFIQGAVRQPGVFNLEKPPTLLELISLAGGMVDQNAIAGPAFIFHKNSKTDANAPEYELKKVDLKALLSGEVNENLNLEPDDIVQVPAAEAKLKLPYFIQGAVHSPGVFNLEKPPTLLELISLAGGMGPSIAGTAYIIHKIPKPAADAPEYELKKANLRALLRGEFTENVKLEPEDVVQIPPADVFFVAGEVRSPGSFPLKEGSSVRQAISMAQGTSSVAAPSRAVIFREGKDGKQTEIPIDLNEIMRGKKPDMAIAANDIIVVPNSKSKSVFVPVLNAFGVNAASAATRIIVP